MKQNLMTGDDLYEASWRCSWACVSVSYSIIIEGVLDGCSSIAMNDIAYSDIGRAVLK